MRKMFYNPAYFYFPLFLTLVLSWLPLSAEPAAVPDELVFAGDVEYPPLSFLKDGEPAGHDVDFIKAIAAYSGKSCGIRLMPWSGTLEALRSGEVDVVTGILKTPERSLSFDFTAPYLVETYAIFTRKESGIRDTPDLAGKTSIMLRGDASIEQFMVPNGLDSAMDLTASQPESLQLVDEGIYDFTIAPYSLGLNTIRERGFGNLIVTGRPVLFIEYRFAVRKGRRALLFMLNDAIAALKQNGEYDRIHDRWRFFDRFAFATHSFSRYVPYILVAAAALLLAALLFLLIPVFLRRKISEKTAELRRENRFLRHILDSLPQAVFWKDTGGKFLGCNDAFLRDCGMTAETEIVGKTAEVLSGMIEGGSCECELQVVRTGIGRVDHVEERRSPDGERRWTLSSRLPLSDEEGRINGVLGTYTDVTDARQRDEEVRTLVDSLSEKNRMLRAAAVTEPLTGLFNRRYLLEKLSAEIALYERYSHPFSVIFLQPLVASRTDASQAGAIRHLSIRDKLFIDAGETLKQVVRSADTVGRYSDDLFLIILPHTRAAEAETLAERLRAAASRPDGRTGRTEASFFCGVREYAGEGVDGIIDRAYETLQLSKPRGVEVG